MRLHAATYTLPDFVKEPLKKPLKKLNHGRSRLYEQLGKRPKQHFAQKNKLYTIATSNLAPAFKNKEKMRGAKSARPKAS